MIKSFQKTFALFFTALALCTSLLAPITAYAATDNKACTDLENQITNSGFNVKDQLPVYCTTGSIYTKFLNGALYAVGIVAVIAIVYGGYLYMTAQSNAEQSKRARNILTWAVLGLIVVIVAALLVNVVINLLVENRFV
ncbi:MAG TPA: pilin [Patescibacteria group bacterium]|jgi:cytochrome bd-type quinol oxidase subunit 2|nr:pilin [Patescibacteria group bacterium]